MILTFGIDHGTVAIGNELRQFQGKPKICALIRGLCVGLNSVDAAFSGLYSQRSLATAVGAQLDGIGVIVGQTRSVPNVTTVDFFGFADQTNDGTFGEAPIRDQNQDSESSVLLDDLSYQALLYYKIALNNGHGTIPELYSTLASVFTTSPYFITIAQNGNAALTLNLYTTQFTSPLLAANAALYIPSAAGITITLTTTEIGG